MPVADLTLGFMLALARHIYTVNWLLKTGQMTFNAPATIWRCTDSTALRARRHHRRVWLASAPSVGASYSACAPSAVACWSNDPFVAAGAIESAGAQAATLDEVVRAADMLTLHCPDTPDNYGLISAERIRAIEAGGIFLNLARAAMSTTRRCSRPCAMGTSPAPHSMFSPTSRYSGESLRAAAERAWSRHIWAARPAMSCRHQPT